MPLPRGSVAGVWMTEYKVQFEVFEGPLDLLLYLVKKEEVDIYEVNLTRIATQFVEYLDMMRQLDLEVAGEFLVMAATLMHIKSRELLPVEQQAETEAEDEEEDPRWELIRQLVEYKKFKDAAAGLHTRELEQEHVYTRVAGQPDLEPHASPPGPRADLFELIAAVTQILKRCQAKEGPRDIFEDKWTVSEKIDYLRTLLKTQDTVRFSELFEHTTSRSEVVVTFLALLELIRLSVAVAVQEALFAEIEIRRCDIPTPTPASETHAAAATPDAQDPCAPAADPTAAAPPPPPPPPAP
jgi:segregation and condensation protein A